MNRNVKKLTDGAMMVAIMGVVLVIDRQFAGILESMVLFLFPIPMVVYAAKYGWKDSWLVYICMVILSALIGFPTTIFYVASESMMGMVYGAGIYKKVNSHKLLMATMIIGVFVNIISMVVFASFFGYDLNADIAAYKDVIAQVEKTAGVSLYASIDLDSFLKTVFVISAVLTGIMEGYITQFASRLLLKRLHFDLPPKQPLFEYMPPLWTGYVGLAGMMAYYYSIYRPVASAFWQNAMQGFGMAGFLYLILFGVIGLISLGRIARGRTEGLNVILSILLAVIASLASAVFGFLYITTNIHRRALEGAANASKTQ